VYQIDDVVVYRRNVCKVVGKDKSDLTGEQCYVLVPYCSGDCGVRMMVPVANRAGNLRDVATKDEIKSLIKSIPNLQLLENKPANMKSQYVALLKGNDLVDLARIIKTSYYRNKERIENHKKLASIDGEYLEKAENFMFNEFSVALDMPYEKCKEFFIGAIRKLDDKA
jgi:CarD family transcriptional regulator